MALRVTLEMPRDALDLLRCCYRFVDAEWQHVPRDATPDQGFEAKLRECCVSKMPSWIVSQHREMNLGLGFLTASGVLHETDIIARNDPVFGMMELKNRSEWPPDKNDVIVFFAKMLDYFCLTPAILRSYLVPVFISCFPFDQSGLAACLGLGIHPIEPMLRPIPLLIDNANRMGHALDDGLTVPSEEQTALEEFCNRIRNLSSVLAGADANERFDCFDDSRIAVTAFGVTGVHGLADELRSLNGECSRLIQLFKAAKGA